MDEERLVTKKLFYDFDQAARKLNVSKAEIGRMVAQHQLGHTQVVGNRTVIPAFVVDRMAGAVGGARREAVGRKGARTLRQTGASVARSASPGPARSTEGHLGKTAVPPLQKEDREGIDFRDISEQVRDNLKRSIAWSPSRGKARKPRGQKTVPRNPSSNSAAPPSFAFGKGRLSLRTRNCLSKVGILTLDDLRGWPREGLLALPGFGKKCLREVESFLADQAHPPSGSTPEGSPNRHQPLTSGFRQAPPATERGAVYPAPKMLLHESPAYPKLSTRTRNCLATAGVRSVGDLSVQGAEKLLSLRDFGAQCLREVESFLEAHGTAPEEGEGGLEEIGATPRPESLEELLVLLATLPAARARLEGWAASSTGLALRAAADLQSKVEAQLSQGILDDQVPMGWHELQALSRELHPPAYTLSDLLLQLQYLLCAGAVVKLDALQRFEQALDTTTVDEEIAYLLTRLDNRALRILRGRSLPDRQTLAELGKELGVSRERVRQLEGDAAAQLKRSYATLPLPRIRTAMMLVRRTCTTFSVEEIHERLCASKLISDDSVVGDFLAVWQAIQPDLHPFPEEIPAYAKTGLTRWQRSISKEVISTAHRHIRRNGAVAFSELVAELEATRCSHEDVAAVLAREGLTELGHGYWGTVRSRYWPHRVVEKMVDRCGPLHVRHLRGGLLRHQKRHEKSVLPAEILLAMLEQHERFLVTDDGVVHLRGHRGYTYLGRAEDAWLSVVRRHGPVVDAGTIRRGFAEWGLSSASANYLMHVSELVRPVGRGLYCLPGARPPGEDDEPGLGSDSGLAADFPADRQVDLIRSASRGTTRGEG